MHYSNKPSMVRVDYFKEGGKWYTTSAVDMEGHYNSEPIHEALARALEGSGENVMDWKSWVRSGGYIVCLEPYHEYSHPITLTKRSL